MIMTKAQNLIVRRQGDGNPLVFLSVETNSLDGALTVLVNTAPDGVTGMLTESLRYRGNHGGRSLAIQLYLGNLWQQNQDKLDSIKRRIDFEGTRGCLCLQIRPGDSDYHLKTHDEKENVYAGVSVIFPCDHPHYLLIVGLRKAMMDDEVTRPLK